jgi:hypothetical protein
MNVIRNSLGLLVAGLLVTLSVSPIVPERNSDNANGAAVPASAEHGSWQADFETEGPRVADLETEGRKVADLETEGRKLADIGHETEGRQLV